MVQSAAGGKGRSKGSPYSTQFVLQTSTCLSEIASSLVLSANTTEGQRSTVTEASRETQCTEDVVKEKEESG